MIINRLYAQRRRGRHKFRGLRGSEPFFHRTNLLVNPKNEGKDKSLHTKQGDEPPQLIRARVWCRRSVDKRRIFGAMDKTQKIL
jgi:hypothetical protein